ncbi:MAG: metalloregulator ArsR/SmtB family transcription factor [Pseudomonadota bacterium]
MRKSSATDTRQRAPFSDASLASLLSALANEDRLCLLRALVRAGPTGLPAGALAEALSASPSRTSFHLAALAEHGIVRSERKARQVIYRVDFPLIGAMIDYFVEDCCAGDDALKACCATCC